MKNMMIKRLCLLIVLAPSAMATLADKGQIRLKNVAHKEIVQINEKGKKVVKQVSVAKVLPGETIIYTSTFSNVGAEMATDIIIDNPVPDNMVYLPLSAAGKNTRVFFSIDGGKSYGVPSELVMVKPNGAKRQARPDEYTHIRWKYKGVLPAGDAGLVSFRAKLL